MSSSMQEPLLSADTTTDENIKVITTIEINSEKTAKNASTDDDSTSVSSTQTSPRQISRNIPGVLAYTLSAFSGRSTWNQSVLPAYVYLLRKDAASVGFITAVNGITNLLVSFPAGVIADKYARRDRTLRTASIVGLAAIVTMSWSTLHSSYEVLVIALALWGMYNGIVNTVIGALFADSIYPGERSKYFTKRTIAVKLGAAVGPLVSIIMFFSLGDEWTVRDCSIVILIGQVMCIPSIVMLWFLSDDHAVVDDQMEENDGTEPDTDWDTDSVELENSDASMLMGTANHLELSCSENDEAIKHCYVIPRKRFIPILVASADLIAGLAAGMSVRYFPIFFLDNLEMKPVSVQVLYLISPLSQALLAKVAQWGGKKIGRCQMAVLFKFIGVSCLFLMIASFKLGLSNVIICAFYFFRTCFMNSTSALTKSLLMDNVPPSERAKWSALESVNTFSWSGSAALGGLFVKSEGIFFNFYITGGLQLLATLPLIFLFNEDATME